MKKVIIILITALALPGTALAGLVNIDFNNGDSLTDWSVDRQAPSSFDIIDNQLVMGIVGIAVDSITPYNNTRGMQMDIGQSNYLSIDMFIDSSWDQDARYGGIWAIGHEADDTIGGWPIIEYQGSNGFAVWDNSGWNYSSVDVDLNLGGFNNLSFMATSTSIEYYINNNLFYTDTSGDVDHFSGVILNAKNVGNDYTVIYDNLKYGTVPEPSILALMGLGIFGLGLSRRKMKK